MMKEPALSFPGSLMSQVNFKCVGCGEDGAVGRVRFICVGCAFFKKEQ